MKTITITSNGRNVEFTTKSVTIDGREYLYSDISELRHSAEKRVYGFKCDGEVCMLPYEEKDAAVVDAIFDRVQALHRQRAQSAPAPAPQAPDASATGEPAAAVSGEDAQLTPAEKKKAEREARKEEKRRLKEQRLAEKEEARRKKQEAKDEALRKKQEAKEEAQRKKQEAKEEAQRKKQEAREGKVAETAQAVEETPAVEEAPVVEKTPADATIQIETPAETPVEIPTEVPDETPAAPVAEVPAEATVETPAEAAVEAPAEVTAEAPDEDEMVLSYTDIEDRTGPEHKSTRFKKSIIIFIIVLAVLALASVAWYFLIGPSSDSQLTGPEDTTQYNDINDMIDDLEE